MKKVSEVNAAYQSVFEYTAENHVQTKMLTWLTLFLTYVKDPGTVEPRALFTGSTYDAKEEKLGDLEDARDPLYFKALEKLPRFWMLYLFGRANKPEDFAKLEKEWAEQEEAQRKMREQAEKTDVLKTEASVDLPLPPDEEEPGAAPVVS